MGALLLTSVPALGFMAVGLDTLGNVVVGDAWVGKAGVRLLVNEETSRVVRGSGANFGVSAGVPLEFVCVIELR